MQNSYIILLGCCFQLLCGISTRICIWNSIKKKSSVYRVGGRAEALEVVPADRVFARSSVAFMLGKNKAGARVVIVNYVQTAL